MRFMVMHKVTKQMEEGGPVDQQVVTEMGKLINESLENGVFQNGAGLKPTKFRTRVSYRGGEFTFTDGPYQGSHELPAGFAILKVKTKDEALEWARKFARVVGDVELEVGLVVEGWDLTGAPRPPGAPLRYLVVNKADRSTEAGTPPSEREQKEMGALMAQMQQAGVLQWTEGVRPSREASRVTFKGGKHTVVDGPFAESKELIAGFSLINVASKEEALKWTERYGRVLGDIEVDVLRLWDEPAFSS